MSFGFSVGDIIAGATLCYDVAKAINDGPKELVAVRSSLKSLTSVLRRVDRDFEKLTEEILDDENRKEELEEVMIGCRATVKQLRKIVDKYSSLDPGKKKGIRFKAVKWSLVDAKALPGIQTQVGRHLDALNTLMNAQQG